MPMWLAVFGVFACQEPAPCAAENLVCEITASQSVSSGVHKACFCEPPDAAPDEPLPEAVPTRALADGFDVPSVHFKALPLERFEGVSAAPPDTMAWKGDKGTEHVECAVFICDPEVREMADGAERIVNYDRCAVRRARFDRRQIEWSPTASTRASHTGLHLCHRGHGRDHDCACTRHLRPRRLTWACWGLSTWRITAASPLMPLDAEQARRFDPIPADAWVETCDDHTEDRSCLMPPDAPSTFGVCDAGLCRLTAPDDLTTCLEPPQP